MTADSSAELFDGGPLRRWERSLGLIKPGRQLATRRILVAVVITWVPLAVLTTVQFLFFNDESAKTFFSDFAVHARCLMALPALIMADAECIPRLGRIIRHFAQSGLIVKADQERFRAVVASTRRLLDSGVSDVIIVVLVYLGVAALAVYFSHGAMLPWHRRESAAGIQLSAAGWWHALVSLPLLLVIFLGWFWRVLVWTRLLFVISRLDLYLIPGHPDRVGGLMFVSTSLRGFRLVSLATGALVAGSIANRQFHQGISMLESKKLVIGMLVFLVLLFAGPLLVFLKKIRQTKARGIFEYGGLARSVGIQFEEKWIYEDTGKEGTPLEVQDFSATTDLYAIVENVHQMRDIPFTLKDLIGPVGISAMLPFIPLALMSMPLDVILRGILKLLF